MSLTTVLKEGGLIPYLVKSEKDSFLNIPQVPYYDDISKLGNKQILTKIQFKNLPYFYW